MSRRPDIAVVGAGLAGCEAALQLARRGFLVRLYEQKPQARSEAASSDRFAELVCSNSFRARSLENAVGLVKEEMRRLGSFFMAAAARAEVPAGGAMAVDRERFAAWMTEKVQAEPNVEIVSGVVDAVPEGDFETIVATGPLTGGRLADYLRELAGSGYGELHFYDAIAPIVDAETIDMDKAFFASRYDKGGDDYLNLPLDEPTYRRFVDELVRAERVLPREFEDPKFFESCLPVDVLADRGPDTLAFGPMKPVGLVDPKTGKRPHAVVQLRREDKAGTAYNLVGFQTRLTYPDQKRIFRTIPGLEHAEFLRFGTVHRNTFLDAPRLLDRQLRLRTNPRVLFAGQISGVEGYVESAACGLVVAILSAARLQGAPIPPPPPETMLGGMLNYLATPQDRFQPSHVNHAMLPPPPGRKRGSERKLAYAERALAALERWVLDNAIHVLEPEA
ncbi:MAG: methylenetetrahydrofolate--tRNA-(uracil(54)-C(5))-methyltransferase (FADH(2)-oxidizing) TrmFO [Myxococcales bacterium]|nr:MAG: methylenetetrahydrofolate--tRNA-(uracil(54)-C(5))-methyltransferase (FADH(2)-oxidizing) TrmFO [Myxococcales bacterium]